LLSLGDFLTDPVVRQGVIDLRDSWYPHLDHRADLVRADKLEAEKKIAEFHRALQGYKVGKNIKDVRDKALAHITTATPVEPFIMEVTGLADEALKYVQDAHDIFVSGDSGLARRRIFANSAKSLVGGLTPG
jgi:hypothetical protein